MVKKFLLLVSACFWMAATGSSQTTATDSFVVDGAFRSYRLYTPKQLKGSNHPLVINMHGLGSNAFEQEYYANFAPVADTAGFYVVMPQGTSFGGTNFWNVGLPGTPPVDDVKFIGALMDQLVRTKAVDPARIYATGMSNGGFMSYYLAMKMPGRIAAIASVTGSIVPEVLAAATKQRAIPVMEIHGTADGTVPYTGSAINAHVDSVLAFWIRNNGCSKVSVQKAVPNANLADGCTADNFVYKSSNGLADVELYRINGGGHTWPGAPFTIGVTNMDFSASREIWRFFSKYRLSAAGVSEAGDLGARSGLQVFPNPVAGALHLRASGKGTIQVHDMRGACVATTDAKDVDMSSFPAGMYTLRYTTVEGSNSVLFRKGE